MTMLMMVNLSLLALNGLLAVVVGSVYLRNHRELRSPFTLALVLFAAFIVVHSALTFYHSVTMMATYTPRAEAFILAESVLELAALSALAYATLR